MDLRDLTKINSDITYFQAMKYVFFMLTIIGIISSYPSINTNYKYLSNIEPENANKTIYIALFVAASILIDLTKIIFLSTFIKVKNIFNGRIDSILTIGTIIFFSLSFFFSYNGLKYASDKEQAQILKSQILGDSISIISLNNKSTRADRKKAEANSKQLANIIELKKQTANKTQQFNSIKNTLINKDFQFLLFMDLICIFCVLSCSYISSKKGAEKQEEEISEINKETIKNIQSRYRAAASRNDQKNIEKYKNQLLSLGAKIPQSKINENN